MGTHVHPWWIHVNVWQNQYSIVKKNKVKIKIKKRKNLLQHHSSKASVLQYSASFLVQLSHPYMTTGKTVALTRWAFVGKVMSLLFNMLSRLVIAFLLRGKQEVKFSYMAAITIFSDLESKKIKSVTVSIVSPSICHEVMGPDAMILAF